MLVVRFVSLPKLIGYARASARSTASSVRATRGRGATTQPEVLVGEPIDAKQAPDQMMPRARVLEVGALVHTRACTTAPSPVKSLRARPRGCWR